MSLYTLLKKVMDFMKRFKKPINEAELVKDWIAGVKWNVLRTKYHCRTDMLREIVERLKLPSRHCGPILAKDIPAFKAHNKKRLEDVINAYVNGVQLPVIMKKYHIGYETFREIVKPYFRLRKKCMRDALLRRNREVKRQTGRVRQQRSKADNVHLLNGS